MYSIQNFINNVRYIKLFDSIKEFFFHGKIMVSNCPMSALPILIKVFVFIVSE
jgi:hypothetical protein